MLTVYTFGDSILDCGIYNDKGITPGALIVENDDGLFPEFAGRDLKSRGPAALVHRAVDGATLEDLPQQTWGVLPNHLSFALITIGGNDLLAGLLEDDGRGIEAFGKTLETFLDAIPIRPILLGNVYDPTFGEDSADFFGYDPAIGRANHRRLNGEIARVAPRFGRLVDIHSHFLGGDPTWYTRTIEPSLIGASEVRRVFLDAILADESLA